MQVFAENCLYTQTASDFFMSVRQNYLQYSMEVSEKMLLLQDIEDEDEDPWVFYKDVEDDFNVSVKKGNAFLINVDIINVDASIPKGCNKKELLRNIQGDMVMFKEQNRKMSFLVYVTQRLEQQEAMH